MGLVDCKFIVNESLWQIQIHKTLLYVNGISRFLQFLSCRGGAYSSLLVGEGPYLGLGHLLGRIR